MDVTAYFQSVSLNMFFNYIDIYLESLEAMRCLKVGEYACFGTNIGKIISDVFLKNPLTSDWTLNNSEVFTREGVTATGPMPLRNYFYSGS